MKGGYFWRSGYANEPLHLELSKSKDTGVSLASCAIATLPLPKQRCLRPPFALSRNDAKPSRSKVVHARVFQGAQASRLCGRVVTGEPESRLAGTEMAPRQTPVLLGHAPSLSSNSEWPWKRSCLCCRPAIAVGFAWFRLRAQCLLVGWPTFPSCSSRAHPWPPSTAGRRRCFLRFQRGSGCAQRP